MRRFLFLALLCLILAATIALSRSMADWYYVMPSDAGKLLYITTFEDFSEEWDSAAGLLTARMVDGKMRVEVDAPNSLLYAPTRFYFTDFDMTVDAMPVEGPLNNGYGVVFRLIDGKNNYRFHISSDGYYKIEKQVDDQTKILSNWALSSLVKQGLDVTNQLRVIAHGGKFQFYINGQQVSLCIPDNPDGVSTPLDSGECYQGQWVDTLADDTFTAGKIGISAETFDETGVVVDFDNVIVYGAEAIE